MSLFKPPRSENWYYDFWIKGSRFSGSTFTANRRDAAEFEKQQKRQAKEEVTAAERQRTEPMTVSIACTRYWEEIGRHAARPDAVNRGLEWLCRNLGEKTLLRKIGDAEVARLVSLRRGERVVNVAIEQRIKRGAQKARKNKVFKGPKLVSNATVNRSVTELLRKVIRRAANVWKEPVQVIDWKQHLLREPQERVRELRLEEEAALLAELSPVMADLARFAIKTGLREANAVLLEWSQVDFGARTLTVTAKGGRPHTVEMIPAVRELLWAQQGRHAKQVWAYDDGEPMTVWGAVSALRRALKRAGIENFRFHDLRHTAATRMVRVTGNLKLAKELLGHTELATTSRYAHVTRQDVREAMEAVEKVYSDAGSPKQIPKQRSSDAEKPSNKAVSK